MQRLNFNPARRLSKEEFTKLTMYVDAAFKQHRISDFIFSSTISPKLLGLSTKCKKLLKKSQVKC